MGEMIFVQDPTLSCITDGAIWAEASCDASGGAVVHVSFKRPFFQRRDLNSTMQKGWSSLTMFYILDTTTNCDAHMLQNRFQKLFLEMFPEDARFVYLWPKKSGAEPQNNLLEWCQHFFFRERSFGEAKQMYTPWKRLLESARTHW